MPSKKKQRNGFYFFMKDQIDYYQTQDKQFNMTTIVPIAHPKWQDLSTDERQHYNNIAKQWKQQHKLEDDRMDSTGRSVKEVMAEEHEEQRRTTLRTLYIREMIGGMGSIEEVAEMKFYLINFNIFTKTQEGMVIPAEVGLVEYSIREGVSKEYHEFINPGEIPRGYGYSARQHSDDTHKIPVQEFGNNNYMYIYTKLKSMTESPGEAKYPVFCMEDEIEQTEAALEWLCNKSLDRSRDAFVVYDVARLLLEFCRFAKDEEDFSFVDSPALMKDWLTKTSFNHVPKVSCQWHEAQDASNFCSLSVVKCFCYLMSERLCKVYRVDMVPYCHLPPRTSSENDSILDWSKIKIGSSASSAAGVDTSGDRMKKSFASASTRSSSEPSQPMLKNTKSKPVDKVEDEVHATGATSGLAWGRLPTASSTVSAASFLRKKDGFQMNDEEFPPMGATTFGRGSGRGRANISLGTAVPQQQAARPTVGLGRGGIKPNAFKDLLP